MGRVRTRRFAWDFLAVARPGMYRRAAEELATIGEFRPCGYPLLLVGRNTTGNPALEAVAAAEREGLIGRATARVTPCDGTVVFPGDDVTESLCDVLADRGSWVAGRSFFVRVHLRGLKGRIQHPAVERALGAFLYERAVEVGTAPTVSFDDADLAVVIEVVGDRAGYAFLDRRARALELVRVR